MTSRWRISTRRSEPRGPARASRKFARRDDAAGLRLRGSGSYITSRLCSVLMVWRGPAPRMNSGDRGGAKVAVRLRRNARGQHEQGYRNRSRHDEQLRRDHGGPGRPRDRERRGRAHHAVDGGIRRGRRASRRAVGQAAGGHQSGEHAVRDQAADRPQVQRSLDREGQGPGALPDRRGRQRRRLGDSARQELQPQPGERLHPAKDEGDRRKLSRRIGCRGGGHGSRLLQRFPAPGDQRRRQDRWPRRAAHHQRADRRGARLRAREEGRRHHRRLRPWRRHLRRVRPRDRRRGVRGALDQRRHVPRRRGLRQAHHRLPRRRVQKGTGHRPTRGSPGAATPQGRRREGEDRAVELDAKPRSTCHSSPPIRRGRSIWPSSLPGPSSRRSSRTSSSAPSSRASGRSRMPGCRRAKSRRSSWSGA